MKGFLRVEMSVTLISRIICYYMCVCTQFGKEREAVLLLRSVACCTLSVLFFFIYFCVGWRRWRRWRKYAATVRPRRSRFTRVFIRTVGGSVMELVGE